MTNAKTGNYGWDKDMQIPLGQLTKVVYRRGPQVIKSEDTFLTGYVLFDKMKKAAEVDVVENAQEYLQHKIDIGELVIPAGVTYEFAGSYQNQIRSQKTLNLILPIALLTQKRAASNSAQGELERTKGRRFAVMQEPSEQDKINIGFMKELSGNDRILCRALYKEPYEFKPQFKMILTCNELPEVPSDDGGTWRRIRVIEFLSKFCEKSKKTK